MSIMNNTAPASFTARIAGFVAEMRHRRAQYATYRDTLAQLEGLSDRDLADLGIARATIRSIAYQAAYEG